MLSVGECLGIEVPVLQAPIGSASSPELVAAVSNAGGLGMLAGTWLTPAELRDAILKIKQSTAKPFAVNLGVHAAPAEKIELCLDCGVPVISLFWGDARNYFQLIKRRNAKVVATVGNPAEASDAEDAGADVVIAQGFEAGGHIWGKLSLAALIPEVCDKVKRAAVIAAGGIGDGRGIAAAMQLGATGACLGTRFVLASESLAHPVYQQALIQATAEDTFYGEVFSLGWPNAPHRVLVNSTVRAYLEHGVSKFDEAVAYTEDGTTIPRLSCRLPTRNMSGGIEEMALYAGLSVGLCRKRQPAAEIVRELLAEASHC